MSGVSPPSKKPGSSASIPNAGSPSWSFSRISRTFVVGRLIRSAAARTAASAGPRVSSEKISSRAGTSSTSGIGSIVRWLSGSNERIDSTVSPKNSIRVGRG